MTWHWHKTPGSRPTKTKQDIDCSVIGSHPHSQPVMLILRPQVPFPLATVYMYIHRGIAPSSLHKPCRTAQNLPPLYSPEICTAAALVSPTQHKHSHDCHTYIPNPNRRTVSSYACLLAEVRRSLAVFRICTARVLRFGTDGRRDR